MSGGALPVRPYPPVSVARGPVGLRWELVETLAVLAAGLDTRSAARMLNLSAEGVRHRVRCLYRDLGCTHAAAVARAYDLGFLPVVGFGFDAR